MNETGRQHWAGTDDRRARVLIAGGGVAALEAILALRALVGERVRIELISPEDELVYAPMTIAEPFELGRALAFDLAAIAAELHVDLRRDTVESVAADRHLVLTGAGEVVPYDALVVAVGAHRRRWLPGAVTFGGRADERPLRELLSLLGREETRRIAFAGAPGDSWSLPLYELALLTDAYLRRRGRRARITVVTPEDGPLGVFGRTVSDGVRELLRERDIDCWCDSYAAFFDQPRLQVVPDGRLFVDAVVATAHLEGRAIDGLPHDRRGFIPTDDYGRVPGVDGVYAAGDGTASAIKQGGVAAQEADMIASHLAQALGTPVELPPAVPVLRGLLLTGAAPLYLQATVDGSVSTVGSEPLWWPPAKIAGRHLAPYLAELARSGRGLAAAAVPSVG